MRVPLHEVVRLASIVSFAAVPAFGLAAEPEALSPYGVCAHVARGDEHPYAKRELPMMRTAGIGWVRTDFAWSGVERQPGQWHFEMLDETVDWAEAERVRILPILDYDVAWARPAHEHLDLWLDYVRRVVTRYKDRIRHWEVWNEPNLEKFWKDKPDPAAYVKLLRATHREIKRIDPGLVVVLGGTAGIPWEYIEGIYEAGGRGHFDVMNVHPYRYPGSPEERPLFDDLVRLRELMQKHGDAAKPVWITEMGWPTHQGPRGVSEQRQALMFARSYLLALQSGVEVVFWYEFQATEGRTDYNEHHFGIVHRELDPKPAYQAMKTLAQVRPAGSAVLEGTWRTGGVYHPGWQRLDGTRTWAVWRPGEDVAVQVDLEGPLSGAMDHLGRPVEVAPQGGRLTLSVGESPVYLVGPTRLEVRAAGR